MLSKFLWKDDIVSTDLIINVTHYETRVALIENGTVSELYTERSGERSIAGNIYKGRVVRVLPGMQAAFVDIGLDKAAFLYVSDVYDNLEDFEKMMTDSEEDQQASAKDATWEQEQRLPILNWRRMKSSWTVEEREDVNLVLLSAMTCKSGLTFQ